MTPLLFAALSVASLVLALAAGDGPGAWLMMALATIFVGAMMAAQVRQVSDEVDRQTK